VGSDNALCTAWRKGLRTVWYLPYQIHCYLLPLLSHCQPVFDEMCSGLMNFVSTCSSHTSKLIRYVADHCIRFGLNFSPFGRNILFFFARRYGFDVDDVFFNKFSYFRDVIHVQYTLVLAASLLLLETVWLICYLNVHCSGMVGLFCLLGSVI